jgi:SAM-dependent methyltransferase
MLKYISVALCLKGFSCGSPMRRLYRKLGNSVGGKRRANGQMPRYYVKRIARMLRLAHQYGIVRDGDRIIELGTGWLHWEALTLRLFFDIEAVLFDVWDNRQLASLKNYVGQLKVLLRHAPELDLSQSQLTRAESLIALILKVESFEELYKLLDFQYVVDSSGSLRQFPDDAFQLVTSAGVLEHVVLDAVPTLVGESNRILKPGGWASHCIDMSDHLAHYDTTVSKMKYLSFSELTWKSVFENKVQYINRIRRSEWLDLFRVAGAFDVVEELNTRIDISQLKLAKDYANMNRSDLNCTDIELLLRKPISDTTGMVAETTNFDSSKRIESISQ